MITDWQLIDVSKEGITIQLYFRDPIHISAGDLPDILFVQLELQSLETVNGANFLPCVLKRIAIPPQMKLDDVVLVQNSGQILKTATESTMGVAILQKLAPSGSLSLIWS